MYLINVIQQNNINDSNQNAIFILATEIISTYYSTEADQICLIPQHKGCDVPNKNPLLIATGTWKQRCGNIDSQFLFDPSSGLLIHKCSGKPVCSKGGSWHAWTEMVIDEYCPLPQAARDYIMVRTLCKIYFYGENFFFKSLFVYSGIRIIYIQILFNAIFL